jgi:hypothetical protein
MGGGDQKKIYSQKKIRKKKIFPGIVQKKKFLAWKIGLYISLKKKNFQPSSEKKNKFLL